MIILTGTMDSPARPALAAVTPAALAAKGQRLPAIPVEGNFLLDGLELSHLTSEESKALSKVVKKAVSAISPETKGAVKALDLWLSTKETVAAFQTRDGSWFAVIDAGIGAAGDLAAVAERILPALTENRVFRIVDDSLTLAAQACKLYDATTAKPSPSPDSAL